MRIDPLLPPYPQEFTDRMKVLMRGAEPLVLFTALAKHDRAWAKFGGGSLLDKGSPLSLRQREIVIDRTTAVTGCEYEWGVHIAGFAQHVGLTDAQVKAFVHGDANDPAWSEPSERALIVAADALLARKRLNDAEWLVLSTHFDEAQVLEIIQLVAFYTGVSMICGALDLPLETSAARFPVA